ncbi:lanthionine synthetase LanC family protein [Streptomyces sp. NPDC001834]|uniref:lanthionine synthetase LanC family protein n=1 Tax=Streptomyces sp. NPDC001834 TaxID=3364616 RepID=UPI0036BD52B4
MHPGRQEPSHRAASDVAASDIALDSVVLDNAVRLLDDFSEAGRATPDPGIPVLARLVAETCGPAAGADTGCTAGAGAARSAVASAGRAVEVWARSIGRGPGHCGLHHGGLAGTLVGLRLGARIHPSLHRTADRLRDHLLDQAWRRPWRTVGVGLSDYDLVSGPSGTLLALCIGTPQPKRSQLMPFTAHLTELCDSGDLYRLRAGQYPGHPCPGWSQGRVNTGMGHGVAGLVTALAAAVRHVGPWPELLDALRGATRWLVRQSFDDARSIRSWDRAGLDGPPPVDVRARQAWCYGNPGVTWALWDAADALGDRSLADWAVDAFITLAQRYDEGVHLVGHSPTDRLGLYHGAAGVLVVADAFHRHARLPAGAALGTRLAEYLGRRLPAAHAMPVLASGEPRTSLLGGVPGVLSALLTAVYGAPRDWLPCLGLR